MKTKVFYIAPGFTQAQLASAIADQGFRAHEVYQEISNRKRKDWRQIRVRIMTFNVAEIKEAIDA